MNIVIVADITQEGGRFVGTGHGYGDLSESVLDAIQAIAGAPMMEIVWDSDPTNPASQPVCFPLFGITEGEES